MPTGSFFCGGCSTYYKGEEPRYKRCSYCSSEYNKIKALQKQIVSERPQLGRLSPSKLMGYLYDTLKKKRGEDV